jgi:hypothetical protein
MQPYWHRSASRLDELPPSIRPYHKRSPEKIAPTMLDKNAW